jgi:uncharacterized protein YecE (DUF72 family)
VSSTRNSPSAEPDIRVGTSGWSYPSGKGTWNGIFYPAAGPKRRGTPKFDELSFYAEHFSTVEVNSSFYRIPARAVAEAWATRTPPGFEFSLKLYQKFTHPDMFLKSTGSDPSDLTQRDVDEFRTAVDPLARAGKLGALLAQFPPSFKNEPDAFGYLEWLLARFQEYPLAVELRHRSWSDARDEILSLLKTFGAAWAQIDEPKFKGSIRQSRTGDPGAFYYLRLHGRNAAQWWKHDQSEDRYNYLYSAEELEPFADAAKDASRKVRKAYLYANNHFSAKSVANAAILQYQLGQEVAGEYPETFVEHFPELKGIVKLLPEQPGLIPSRKPS